MSGRARAPAPAVSAASPASWLQRKCACGGGPARLGGKCGECERREALGLQARLAMGPVDDPLEREADRVAEQVTAPGPAAPRPSAGGAGAPQGLPAPASLRVSRRAADAGAGAGTAGAAVPASVERTLATPGEPLSAELRAFFEPRFGHDFSQVRVHADALAAGSARSVGALAYTVGQDIAFGAGQYAPGTAAGRRLLAHELAHVVQQSGTGAGAPGRLQRDAAAPGAKPVIAEQAEADDLAGPADTRIRAQLVAGMNAFMDAVIGDPVYESAMTQVTWDKEKASEAQARTQRAIDEVQEFYAMAPARKRAPIPITTTCIAVQQALLKRLQGIELMLGRNQKALGPTAKLVGEVLGNGAWHEARPGMPEGERPRRGDIYVLEFQGSGVVRLVQELTGMLMDEQQSRAKEARITAEREALREQIRSYDPATAPKGTPKPQAWREGILDDQLKKLRKQQAELNRRFAALAPRLEKARAADAVQRGLAANNPVRRRKKLPDFEFSHVGLVVSIRKLPDADPRGGAGKAQERWVTFDGGQQVLRNGKFMEGSTTVERIYHPQTNEITGEKTQRLGPRLLKGWLDVDKLVAPPPSPSPPAVQGDAAMSSGAPA